MKGADFLDDTKGLVILGGIALAAYLGYRLFKGIAPNVPTPANATNADGTPQTAYQNTGPVGYVAAATNAASGGYLSSFGDWLGSKAADVFQPDPMAQADAQLAASQQAWGAPVAAQDNSIPLDYGTGSGW